jgi:hypothetical protein
MRRLSYYCPGKEEPCPYQKQLPKVIYDLNFLISFTISVVSQKAIIEEHIKKNKFIRHYSRNLNIFRLFNIKAFLGHYSFQKAG